LALNDVELCQTLLGDACVGPQDSVWVCKTFADGFAVIYSGFLKRRLKCDFVRGTIHPALRRSASMRLMTLPLLEVRPISMRHRRNGERQIRSGNGMLEPDVQLLAKPFTLEELASKVVEVMKDL
jgi:hypothetical protein